MKIYLTVVLPLLFMLVLIGCSSNDFHLTNVISGTIKEIDEKVQVLYVVEDQKKENIYEIPTEDTLEYKVGQKVEVSIYSNTDTDVWDPKKMKFEIKIIEH